MMKRLVDLVILERLDKLIRRAATGTPEELAKKLNMSRASVYNFIKFLREEMKAPIMYDPGRPSYVYSYTPAFDLGFEHERLTTVELDNAFGGQTKIEQENKEKTKKKTKTVTIEIDVDFDYILDEDTDFNNLYSW